MAAKTRFQKMIDWFLNHKYLSGVIFLAFTLTLVVTFKKTLFPGTKHKPAPQLKNKEENAITNSKEDKSSRGININMHDSSSIDNVINGDQTNNYIIDTSKKK